MDNINVKPYFILYKFATRSRPEKFFKGLDNIIENSSDKTNFKILVSADIDDTTMYNKSVMNRLLPYVEKGYVTPVFGTSKSKIDAINRDMQHAPDNWEILVNFSDDMAFEVYGFDYVIREKMSLHFPDTDGNLYFDDGYAKDRISTMTIMGRLYANRFPNIYNAEYMSVYCDNEYTDVAKKLNKIQYYPIRLYTHNHAVILNEPKDELLIKTESFKDVDYETYERRKARNFDLGF